MQSKKITHVLNVADDVENYHHDKFVYLNLNVSDFGKDRGISRVFDDALAFTQEVQQDPKGRLFIHCLAGQNRSVTVTIAILMKLRNLSLKDAYLYVRERRPRACPFKDNREELIKYEFSIYGKNTMSVEDFTTVQNLRLVSTGEEGTDLRSFDEKNGGKDC